MFILVFHLNGLVVRFQGAGPENIMQDSVVDPSAIDGNHGEHHDESTLSVYLDSSDGIKEILQLSEKNNIDDPVVPLSPQLPPPEIAKPA
jgi:hypothetical protein